MNRRAFLSGLIAAPAVIRVAPLMRIVPLPLYGVGPITWALEEMPIEPGSLYALRAADRLRRDIADAFFIPEPLLHPVRCRADRSLL